MDVDDVRGQVAHGTIASRLHRQPTTNRTAPDVAGEEDMNTQTGAEPSMLIVGYVVKLATTLENVAVQHASQTPEHITNNRTGARLVPVRVGKNIFMIADRTPIRLHFHP